MKPFLCSWTDVSDYRLVISAHAQTGSKDSIEPRHWSPWERTGSRTWIHHTALCMDVPVDSYQYVLRQIYWRTRRFTLKPLKWPSVSCGPRGDDDCAAIPQWACRASRRRRRTVTCQATCTSNWLPHPSDGPAITPSFRGPKSPCISHGPHSTSNHKQVILWVMSIEKWWKGLQSSQWQNKRS